MEERNSRSCPDPDSDQFWRYFGFDLVTGQGRLSTNSILGCGNSEQYFAAGTSEHTKLLIDHSAIHGLVGLTTSRDHRTRVEAVTALGNIASDFLTCPDFRAFDA
ncbi:PREDICTED: importin subunit alpha-1-like [Fragaria vesca subsp. vesca]